MPNSEFVSWLAYRKLYPTREERAELRLASLMAHLWNINRGKNTPPKQPKDFYFDIQKTKPWVGDEENEMSPEEEERALMRHMQAHGIRFVDAKKEGEGDGKACRNSGEHQLQIHKEGYGGND